MRLHLKLSRNTVIVPFNYQENMVGALHKWLEKNDLHDDISLYSFSWLTKGIENKSGFNFPDGSQYFISSYDNQIIKKIIKSIQQDSELAFGMKVKELFIQEEPFFDNKHRFWVGSPVFIKYKTDDITKYYYYSDKESNTLLSKTLVNKLKKAKIPHENVSVRFDLSYPKPRRKGVLYKGIRNIGSMCPVIIEGSPEQIAFAWNVGIGNSTGIGFGSLI